MFAPPAPRADGRKNLIGLDRGELAAELDALGLPTLVPRSKPLADAASSLHELAVWALMAVLAVHVGAALHHALIRRDGVWARMWPPRAR